MEPLALVAGSEDAIKVVIPDLAPASAHRTAPAVERPREDDLGVALEASEILVAETVHVGLSRLPSTYRTRLARNTSQLTAVGLESLAQAAKRFTESLGSDRAPARFFDFALLVEVARELA